MNEPIQRQLASAGVRETTGLATADQNIHISGPAGYVERVTRGGARGWAWLPSSPDAVVRIEAVLGGRVIGHATADQMRPDLLKLNFGSGRHGFTMTFVEAVSGDEAPALRVIGPEGAAPLPGNYALPPPETPQHAAALRQVSTDHCRTVKSSFAFEGYVDRLTRGGARGWVWLPSSPDTVLEIEAVLDGIVIGRVKAGQVRQDLLRQGIGTGRYGFDLSFEAAVAGDTVPDFHVYAPLEGSLGAAKDFSAPTPSDSMLPPRGTIGTCKERVEFRSSAEKPKVIGGEPVPDEWRPIVVLGMHRSGTSALSGGLRLLGVYLGETNELFRGDQWNQAGYHEFAKLVQLNDDLLASLNSAWDAPPLEKDRLKLADPQHPLLPKARDICASLRRRALEHKCPWGFKDPRASLTWPFWEQLLPNARIIVSVRAPLDVVASLKARNQISNQFAMRLCNSYFESLLAATRDADALVVNYATLMEHPTESFRMISEWLGLVPSDQSLRSAAQSIRRELAHHKTSELAPHGRDEQLFRNYAMLASRAKAVEVPTR